MRFEVKIIYETKADDIEKGIAQVEAIINAVGFKDFQVTHRPDQRSFNQNSALHKYFELVEDEARNAGLTMDMLIKKPNELPITRYLLKDLFRLIGKTMYGRESTAYLTKNEMSEVISTFQKIIAERLNISIPFPSLENYHND
jgi:hypothetical protein